jgi:hypothetical protein
MKPTQYIAIFAAFQMTLVFSEASTVEFVGPSSPTPAGIQIVSPMGDTTVGFSTIPNGGTMDVVIDPQALTLTFKSVSIYTGGGSGSVTGSVTTGLGQTDTITSNFTFNPLSFSASNLGTSTLSPAGGGNYSYSTIGGSAIVDLSGSYSMTDGVTTYNGLFNTPALIGYALGDQGTGYLNASNYPGSIALGQSGVSPFRFALYPQGNLFSGEFGSTDVTVGYDIFGLQTANIVTLQEVPEPSTVYLMLGGFGSLLAFRRRRR